MLAFAVIVANVKVAWPAEGIASMVRDNAQAATTNAIVCYGRGDLVQ